MPLCCFYFVRFLCVYFLFMRLSWLADGVVLKLVLYNSLNYLSLVYERPILICLLKLLVIVLRIRAIWRYSTYSSIMLFLVSCNENINWFLMLMFRYGMQQRQTLSCWYFWSHIATLFPYLGTGPRKENSCRLFTLSIFCFSMAKSCYLKQINYAIIVHCIIWRKG